MIEIQGKTIHLRNEVFSYVMQVDPYGNLLHLHFGAPVETADAEAMVLAPEAGWGTAVVPKGEPSLQWLPLEFSGPCTGDYRQLPVELSTEKPVRFFFVEAQEDVSFSHTTPMPMAHGEAETLSIQLASEDGTIQVELRYWLYETALVRQSVLFNASSEEIQVEKLMSASMDISGDWVLESLHGAWMSEGDVNRTPINRTETVLESRTGFSSHFVHPGFYLMNPDATDSFGTVMGWNLIYSGNHYASLQKAENGYTRVMQGLSPHQFRWTLQPGEDFESPQVVLTVSQEGRNGCARQFHSFVAKHIVPAYWAHRERPVVLNSWEGFGFDIREDRLLELADKGAQVGCECFVLDDGWFSTRDHDASGLGDYHPNLKKLPHGIVGLAERIQEKGLQFGLWIEPEGVNADSDLFRAHPDWVLGGADALAYPSRNEYLLDYTRPEVRDYVVQQVRDLLDTGVISYVKWDMNRHSIATGEKAHRYILGLYEVLHRIFDDHPEVLLEGCASGGNRTDLGIYSFAPQIWISDNTDALDRQRIQASYARFYPLSCLSCHVSQIPNAQTGRRMDLSTRGNVAFFGVFGLELNLSELSPEELEEVEGQVRFYKDHRQTFQQGNWACYEEKDQTVFCAIRDEETMAGVFYHRHHGSPKATQIQVPNLPKGIYHVQSRAQSVWMGRKRLGEEVNIKMEVSHKVLAAGITLPISSLGTGITASTRVGGEDGSLLLSLQRQSEE